MSDANLERLRAAMPPDGADLVAEFAGERDFSGGGLIACDATIRFVASGGGESTGVGPQGFAATWRDWLEPWQSYRLFYEEVIDREDTVLTLVRCRGITKHGGVEMEHEAGAVFGFEGDQVTSIDFLLEPHDVLRGV